MIYEKNVNLSRLESIQRTLFKPPENSLSKLGYDRIDHLQTNRIITYHVTYTGVVTRLYALVAPIFALLDVVQFTGKFLYHAITLNFKSALYAICNCAKVLQLFLVNILVWIPSIIVPSHFLRNERCWADIQKAATIKNIEQSDGFKNLQNGVDGLERVLKEEVSAFVLDDATRALGNKCVEEMIRSLPQDLSKAMPIASSYVRMITDLLVTATTNSMHFTQKEEFLALFKELVQIQDPEFKEAFFALMLTQQASLKELTKRDEENTPLLLVFVLRLLTDSSPRITKTSKLAQHNYFVGIRHQRAFLKVLLLLQETSLTKEQNNRVLDSFALLFPAPAAKDDSAKKFKMIEGKNLVKLAKNREKVAGLELSLQGLSPENPRFAQVSKQLADLSGRFNEINAEISNARASIQSHENAAIGRGDRMAPPDITRGLQNLTIILRLPSKEMIEHIIDSLSLDESDGKRYTSLSDDQILKDLFSKVFAFDEQSSQNMNALLELRAPEALLKFHLRLMEYTGADRAEVLAKNKEVILSILQGTYWKSRFNTENNPHLKQIFSSRTDLANKWTAENPVVSKVQDLVPNASDQYKGCEITISKDPSDTLLIGDDLKHCLNLNGRLTRLPGILAFLADGKTQMIVAKAVNNGPSLAQTLIMLLWDETKKQPVLFLEQTYFKGIESGDYTLENASIAYAKQMAKNLGVDLVVSDYQNSDPKATVVGKEYEGSVISLKTSSPIEYVYSFNTIVKPPYTMGQCYRVDDSASSSIPVAPMATVATASRGSADF